MKASASSLALADNDDNNDDDGGAVGGRGSSRMMTQPLRTHDTANQTWNVRSRYRSQAMQCSKRPSSCEKREKSPPLIKSMESFASPFQHCGAQHEGKEERCRRFTPAGSSSCGLEGGASPLHQGVSLQMVSSFGDRMKLAYPS